MGVVEPIKVTITNLKQPLQLEAADFPFAPERGAHKVVLTPEVLIDAADFRMEDAKDYFGLAPGMDGLMDAWMDGCGSLTHSLTACGGP